MAQIKEVRLVDDLDGSEANITIKFGWEGKWRQIDLSTKHSDEFEDLIAPYVDASTVVRDKPGQKPTQLVRQPRTDREQNQATRKWLQENGHPVADRGRIPARLVEVYQQNAGRAL